jgi:hypothetical protein
VRSPPADLLAPHWSAEPLVHNPLNGATGGIWRIQRDDGPAVLKILTPPGRPEAPAHWATSDDPGHWNYWRREALAYREGLARSAYPAIRPPRLLAAVDRPDGSVALWLEYVTGAPGTALTPAGLGDVAQRLGAGHAAWLGTRPDLPWLSRDWLADYTTTRPVAESRGTTRWSRRRGRRTCAPACVSCGRTGTTCWPPPGRYRKPCATTTSGR